MRAITPVLLCALLVGSCTPVSERCLADVEAPCHEPVTVTVTNVVDADTIDVEPAVELPDVGEITRFRLLCIDAPEDTSTVDCYGPEATAWLRGLIDGQEVELRFDGDCVGDFGRGLAYIVHDGSMVNTALARLGYALPADERYLDYPCCTDVLDAAEEARSAPRGGWAECVGPPWVEAAR